MSRLFHTLLLLLFFTAVWAQYPANMYADSAHAPFLFGVASGDPLEDRIILWTKTQAFPEGKVKIDWRVAEDSAFSKLVATGFGYTGAEKDFCFKVDASGLQPGKTYYYRFTANEKPSAIGLAKTLPKKDVTGFKLAVVSCSSIWAGFFNAYKRISERSDIDYVLHLGDYVYDYPDDKQLKRMPAIYPKDCAGLTDWRERHTYYLLDPDLRAARQNKTWIAEWDNHDTDVEPPGKTEEAIQVFYEYMPIRMPDSANPKRIYRAFQFGNLADLLVTDMHLFRGKEEYAPGKKSVLGNTQHEWLLNQLKGSTAGWKIIANQEMMNDWLSEGAPKFIKRGNGRVFDESNWNGFPEDRQRIFDFIETNKINNVAVLTGDIHMSFVIDMTGTPKDKSKYNKRTGEGAIGVELTTPSISRVNMKEAGVPGFLIPAVQNFSRNLNPHHVWCRFVEHGYVTFEVTPERCNAEFWYVPINKITDKQRLGKSFSVLKDKNHWERKPN